MEFFGRARLLPKWIVNSRLSYANELMDLSQNPKYHVHANFLRVAKKARQRKSVEVEAFITPIRSALDFTKATINILDFLLKLFFSP